MPVGWQTADSNKKAPLAGQEVTHFTHTQRSRCEHLLPACFFMTKGGVVANKQVARDHNGIGQL